jgi:cob(I)alamin adenosyltransferase
MKIYTKTGDDGSTGLLGAARVRKDHPRIEAYGEVDELNSVLGLVRAEPLAERHDAILARLQHRLFDLGAELAAPDPTKLHLRTTTPADIEALEREIDALEAELPPLREFILPAGTRAAALVHLARTVSRRAERRLAALAAAEPVSDRALIYVNRLSDLLFVLARSINHAAGLGDVPWRKVN